MAARSAIGGGSMVHRLDFDVGLHRLVAVPGSRCKPTFRLIDAIIFSIDICKLAFACEFQHSLIFRRVGLFVSDAELKSLLMQRLCRIEKNLTGDDDGNDDDDDDDDDDDAAAILSKVSCRLCVCLYCQPVSELWSFPPTFQTVCCFSSS